MALPDDVPWGRAPALAEYIACLSRATGDADPVGFAVLSALNAENSDVVSPWVLRLALSTFFPAPWTPWSLTAAIGDAGLMPFARWDVSADRVGYRSDPDFVADRTADGTWAAAYIERGVRRPDAILASDDDLVLYLMDQLRTAPYPYGWRHDDDHRLHELRATADSAVAAWQRHASLPYIKNWL